MLDSYSDKFRVIEREEFSTPLSELNLAEIKLFPRSTLIYEAVEIAASSKISTFAIGEERIEGIATEDEFLKYIGSNYEEKKNGTLADIADFSPRVLDINQTILEAILTMGSKKLRHMLVQDGEKVRVLLLKDLLRFASSRFEKDLDGYDVKVNWSENGVYLQERTNFDESSEDELDLTTHIFETPIRKVMFNEAIFCDVSLSLGEAVRLMKKELTSSIILMEYETEMRGILTARDLLNKCYGQVNLENTPVSEIMTAAPHKLLEQEVLAVAIKNMNKFKYRNVLVCNQVGYPISIVSILEILSFICSKLKTD
ncbi:CBS domain-containing protein [Halobacteriovorax sp.]|uniref:CBS domain-containing protein n=1 Tax=Halobacteriovorax sp. TaxID=2020862 RepID=UPI003565286B